jgi:hypothetical protein
MKVESVNGTDQPKGELKMWMLDAIDRLTCERKVESYASFETYAEARAFADRHELEARACGWTWVVVLR